MTIINIQARQTEKLKRLKQIKKDIIDGNYSIIEENAGKVPFFNVLNKIQRRNTDKEILEQLNSKPNEE